MKLETTAQEAFSRLRMAFLNSGRRCRLTRALGSITIGGKDVGPLSPDTQTELPNWALNVLLLHNTVELDPNDAFDSIQRLRNIFQQERKHPRDLYGGIPPAPLYVAVAEKIRRLQRDRSALDPRILEEIDGIQRLTESLSNTRLSKILRAARAGVTQERLRQMTPEEKWLCKRIDRLVREWSDGVLST